MISILHPTRGRVLKSYDTIKKWCLEMQRKDTEVIISLDNDDPEEFNYITHYGQNLSNDTGVAPSVICSDNRSAVDAINNAAKQAEGRWMIVVSDDSDCMHHWDNKICLETDDKRDWILKTQDGIQPWIITMPIMDRAYYNRFGYIYHPDYLHMFCDTELSCVADITGRKIKSNLLFPHKHYSVTKEQPDEINKKADLTWAQGENLFLERYKRNFDLPPGKPIEDNGMIRFLQRKAR